MDNKLAEGALHFSLCFGYLFGQVALALFLIKSQWTQWNQGDRGQATEDNPKSMKNWTLTMKKLEKYFLLYYFFVYYLIVL